MRLLRLLLTAFGPFTDAELDLTGDGAHRPGGLHLIYGRNEAGKSSALRAMTDLRFGIPVRSADNFLHEHRRLRIAGIFLDDGDQPVGLARRKGQGATLTRFDPATGAPLDPPAPPRALELALTGGLGREDFESMFGLDHARLRAGGGRLLRGEGELGAALFEASAGTRDIAAVLAALEADAKRLFNPAGTARNAVVNEARRQFNEQRQVLREAQTRPAVWKDLRRAHDQAQEALARIDQDLEDQRRRENGLTELRTVAPLLQGYDRALAEWAEVADVPDLPARAREERLAAEQAQTRACQDEAGAGLDIARCTEALGRLRSDGAVLEHAQAIERLAGRVETLARHRVEALQEEARAAQIARDLGLAAGRIAPGEAGPAPVEALVARLPSEADRALLDARLETVARLGERLSNLREQARALDQAAAEAGAASPPPLDPAYREALAGALRQAQGLGDYAGRIGELDQAIAGQRMQLTQALGDLGLPSVAALRAVRPVLEARIAQTLEGQSQLDQAALVAGDEERRVRRDLDQQRLRLGELTAAGEVATGATLEQARGRRDAGWALIRRAYIERTQEAARLARDFDPERSLPEAFEAAQAAADRQADLLRADAGRAAAVVECAQRIGQMEDRRQQLAAELAGVRSQREALGAAWQAQLAAAGLPDLDPAALREWQGGRRAALECAERLAQAEAERARLVAGIEAARAGLVGLLVGGAAAPGPGDDLGTLIQRAEAREREATWAAAQDVERQRAARQRQAERERLGGRIQAADGEWGAAGAALRAWCERLWLPPESPPEVIKARLEELAALARQHQALGEARVRRAEHLAQVDDVLSQAAALAALLGDPAPVQAEDYADRLKQRLGESREQAQRRTLLGRDLERAQETRQRAAAQLQEQAAILARLCAQAGVGEVAALPEREEAATRKRERQTRLAHQRDQLRQATSRPEAELRAALEGRDPIAIESEQERCAGEIERLKQDQARARQAEGQARRDLEAIDASDRAALAREAMESAAARLRGAIRPWARLRLAQALLAETLSRFREKAQAPMVGLASGYFSLMTGGRYVRLVADDSGDRAVLRVEREGGAVLGVEALSEGTADQLYLALRLAALELRRASHPQMPLILDDVLVTSDDTRAAHCLRALARFAAGGQVLLFTHHCHLLDLARETLGETGLGVHRL